MGALNNNVNTVFTCTATGTGTGVVSEHIGFTGTRLKGYNMALGEVGGAIVDEMARFVGVGPKVLQLQFTETFGSLPSDIDNSGQAGSGATSSYTASSRMFIWRL
jgi:hypothetical protein